jgi:hypothetical protein
MKKTIYLILVAFLIVLGCSKVDDVSVVNPNENQLKSARMATPIGVFDDNVGVLRTCLFAPPAVYTAPAGYPAYVAGNYDLMAHFMYISPEAVTGAVVEFTFQNIQYFVPHITKLSEFRAYTVNYIDNQTVITCTTDLIAGNNPMFCFLVKIDCGNKNNPGLTTFWTDMKVNGVSVKGTIKDKVFACSPVNGSVSYNYTGGYTSPLGCGGVQVDEISGNVEWHVVDHYKNGELEWSLYTPSGSLTSKNKGEVFEIHESDKIIWSMGIYTFHANLVGTQGGHYILFGHADLATWEIVFDKVVCPGNAGEDL